LSLGIPARHGSAGQLRAPLAKGQMRTGRLDRGRRVSADTPRQAIPLSELPLGTRAVVVGVHAAGAIRRRLLEMGFVRGEPLRVEKLAPLGDPMELVIKGYHLSLRREESACILVMRED
jgi:ferrous iron transport protein A